jgi:hypothetical protein
MDSKKPPHLTEANQGYWDRLKRADSWLKRATAIEENAHRDGEDPPSQDLFICYWIAFNALYGRINDAAGGGRPGRYLRTADDDARWFIARVRDLDSSRRLDAAISSIRSADARSILRSHFLYERYWIHGYSKVRDELTEEATAAEASLAAGNVEAYLIALFRRIRVLRNQIFHGCSTHRDSLNRDTLEPAVRVLAMLIPAFVGVLEARTDKQSEFPKIPFPRRRSPQHPD